MFIKRKWLLLILALVGFSTFACSTSVRFQGTDLGGTPAPDFHLTDQNGHAVALSDLRGHVVVLTFVYTQCTDICPLIASKLGRGYDLLGPQAKQVDFVAISVAPEEDTPAAIAGFSQKNGMDGKWLYLNGTRAQLEPVWKAYYVEAQPPAPASTEVDHSSRVVLIDRAGRERVNLDPDFDPNDLVHDVKLLLNG